MKNFIPKAVRLILIALTISLTSCASILYKAPIVRLVDAELGDVSVFSTDVIATLRLHNPNNYPMDITGAQYTLMLNGLDIGQGGTHQRVRIAPFETFSQRVQFQIDNLSMIGNIQRIVEAQVFHYQISGDIYLGDGVFGSSLHVVQEGHVSAPEYL